MVVADDGLLDVIKQYPATYTPKSKANDMAVFQYTSGTTRELPEAVKHSHRTLVTLMFAALYGTGIRPGDEFFCPSLAGLGARPVARHARAAGDGRDHRHFRRTIRCGAADEGAVGLQDHQHVGRRHPLPDDEEQRQGR